MLLKPLTFHAPRTLTEATKLYADLEDVKILAGGTFLLNSLKLLKKKGNKTPKDILSLRKIDELKKIYREGDKLIIKAMMVINDLFESPFLVDNFHILKTVCRNISTNPIRNMATVGGNLTCRYTWTELGAVMVALDADMHFAGAAGQEDIIKTEDFFKNAARSEKIFSHVSIKHDPLAIIAYRRVKKTLHVDVPLLAICVKTNFKDQKFCNVRVTVNNGIAFAQRDNTLETFLEGKKCEPGIEKEALDHLDGSIYDKRHDDYKKYMFRVSLQSAIKEIIEKR